MKSHTLTIRAMQTGRKPNPCFYGTFQRATQGHPVRDLSPLRIVRLIRRKFNDESRRNPTKRDARKAVYCGAIAYWREEIEVMDRFRL